MATELPLLMKYEPGDMTISNPWIKSALARGELVRGLMVSEIRTPMLGAILDAVGADFAIIDQEHGAYGPDLLAGIIAGFRGGRCQPLVRVPEIRRDCFLTPLELGAAGFVVPRVESRAQVEAIVRFCHYPPTGQRGVSLSRAHTGFRRVNPDQYLSAANANILLAVQIETAPALAALDDILSVPGIDMVFIGPSDLSVSCGTSADLNDPNMATMIDQIIAAARRHRVFIGLQTTDMNSARCLVADGLTFISCATDLSAFTGGLRSNMVALEDASKRHDDR